MNIDKLAEQTYGILKSFGFHLKMYDESGAATLKPDKTRFFYSKKQHIMCAIYTESMDIYLNLTFSQEADINEYEDLIIKLRNLSNFHNVIFTTKKTNKAVSPKDFAYLTKVEESMKLTENFISPGIDEIINRYTGKSNIVADVLDFIMSQNGVTVPEIKTYIDNIYGEGTFTANKETIKAFISELLNKKVVIRNDDKKYYMLDDAPPTEQEQAMGHAINYYYSALEILKKAGSLHIQDWARELMVKENLSPQFAAAYINHMMENNKFLFDRVGNIISYKEEKSEDAMALLRRAGTINKG